MEIFNNASEVFEWMAQSPEDELRVLVAPDVMTMARARGCSLQEHYTFTPFQFQTIEMVQHGALQGSGSRVSLGIIRAQTALEMMLGYGVGSLSLACEAQDSLGGDLLEDEECEHHD